MAGCARWRAPRRVRGRDVFLRSRRRCCVGPLAARRLGKPDAFSRSRNETYAGTWRRRNANWEPRTRLPPSRRRLSTERSCSELAVLPVESLPLHRHAHRPIWAIQRGFRCPPFLAFVERKENCFTGISALFFVYPPP